MIPLFQHPLLSLVLAALVFRALNWASKNGRLKPMSLGWRVVVMYLMWLIMSPVDNSGNDTRNAIVYMATVEMAWAVAKAYQVVRKRAQENRKSKMDE